MLRLFVRLLLWAIVLTLVVVWLVASGVVWIIEAVVAWRRKTAMPSFSVPRRASDAKFGRTAGAAVAVIALLMLFGSGDQSGGPGPVQASSAAASHASIASAAAPGATTASATASPNRSNTDAEAAARARADRRAAKARAARRAAHRAKLRAERRAARRAAKARAERRRQERKAAAAAADRQGSAATGGDCDPNYKGACLDANASDYDCQGGSGDGPKYTGTVQVVGSDPFALDRDGDGIACDP